MDKDSKREGSRFLKYWKKGVRSCASNDQLVDAFDNPSLAVWFHIRECCHIRVSILLVGSYVFV